MKTLFALFATIAVLSTGCSSTSTKKLTPSSAKQMLQEQIKDDKDLQMIPYDASLAALGGIKTFTDYEPDQFVGEKVDVSLGPQAAVFVANGEALFHRMLKAGLMTKTEEKDSYQNLTGIYKGRNPYALSSYTISAKQGSPAITGTYRYDTCGGRISGSLGVDGTATITVFSIGGFSPCSSTRSTTYQIERTDAGGIELAYLANGSRKTSDKSANFYREGSYGQATFALTTYRYNFTPKYMKFVDVPGKNVKIGQVRIDNVDKLLLETETIASGQYAWHIDYNAVGKAIYGTDGGHGTGQVAFRKQPDEAWICDSHQLTSSLPGLAKP
jgi:hypothetical protein